MSSTLQFARGLTSFHCANAVDALAAEVLLSVNTATRACAVPGCWLLKGLLMAGNIGGAVKSIKCIDFTFKFMK